VIYGSITFTGIWVILVTPRKLYAIVLVTDYCDGGYHRLEKYASYQKRNPANRGKTVVQPSAELSTLRTKEHFEAVTRKDVLLYTIQGDADKVFV
jgi:hypothetical protein